MGGFGKVVSQMLVEAGLNVKINMSDMAIDLKRAQSTPDIVPALSFGRWSCTCLSADGVLFPLPHRSSPVRCTPPPLHTGAVVGDSPS